MVSAGLFFTCVLLISVEALSIQDLQCAYEETNEYFCEYVQDAYEANADALSTLNKLKPKPLFAGDRRKLRDANRLILELLKKKGLKDLLIVFEKVLKAELQAMDNLKSHCSHERLEETVKAKCEQAREDVGEAIEEVLHAFTELPLVQNSTLARVGAESILDLECAYEEINEDFCEYVLAAYEANAEAVSVLKPIRKFADDKNKLRKANQLIRDLLKKTELMDLLIAIEKALSAELTAMADLQVHCSDESLEEIEKTKCEEARIAAGDATEELVSSIVELPLEQNSTLAKEANAAYVQFGGFYEGDIKKKFPDAALTLGNGVGALSNGDLQCAYEKTNKVFCEYVLNAYQANANVLNKLKPKNRFTEDRKRVSDANQSILEVLKKTELKDLLVAFKKALGEELYAMLELKAHCSE
ncbi:unnamed protein product [Nippostrongylus brasiliensis]|uniref:Venom protein n=1 Tax=Nippostrongylus brasiliensis TaxID=27835 RepID=A0A158QWM3_NIPBR|nr:unnamed protein product [Nippostrongylus brasiliensis]